jgi:SAM-dependent methyltransferase
MARAGPEHLDPAYVAGYDRKARVDPTNDLAVLSERVANTESTLIDFGAGTGTFALAAASQCKRVIAVDISAAMVAAMQTKAAEVGATNVECVQAGFLSYARTGAPADFIHTRNALHHLPDFWKALALQRMAELLRPGGVLHLRDLVFAFKPHEAESFIRNWLDTSAAEPAEDGWTREELEVHLRDEYSTFNWLLEPMIEQAGFEIEQADYGRVRVYAEYICTKASR